MIEYRKRITRAMVQSEPDTLFVFGDNFVRKGFGGQAKEMRGEPNAVGICTKRYPSMRQNAFLSNDDYKEWRAKTIPAYRKLLAHKAAGGRIVWPADGIGSGLARLQECAPRIATAIEVIEADLRG